MNNRVKEAFHEIHADDTIKTNTMAFLDRKTKQYRKTNFFSYKKLAAVAACCLAVLFGWQGYAVYFTPVSTISIDVNPSIELDINRFDKVIDVQSYNKDGDILVSSMNIRFLNYEDALNLLLKNENMASYLTPEQTVMITVFGTNDEKNNEMLADVTSCTASYENVHCAAGHSEEVTEAHSHGLSCGKYQAFLELQALDPDITVEDIRDLSMRQIQDLINERSNNTDDTDDTDDRSPKEDTTVNEGYGHGNGGHHRNRHHGGHN